MFVLVKSRQGSIIIPIEERISSKYLPEEFYEK